MRLGAVVRPTLQVVSTPALASGASVRPAQQCAGLPFDRLRAPLNHRSSRQKVAYLSHVGHCHADAGKASAELKSTRTATRSAKCATGRFAENAKGAKNLRRTTAWMS